MKILFLAPLPPPITGHSLASKVLLDALDEQHETAVVDLTTGSSHDGTVSSRRVTEIFKALLRIVRRGRNADIVYLTIAESLAGNIKDLAIYLLNAARLDRTVIHLHGGSIKRLLFDRRPWVRRINHVFIRRLGGVIILGPSHLPIFDGMIAPERVHLVPNFADESLFLPPDLVRDKFTADGPLRVLFVSGMDPAKGSPDLLAAYRLLPREAQQAIQLDFAGRFATDAERIAFEASLQNLDNVRYHGVVQGAEKAKLFARAHIFCLPTAMFEGQPISILEAYAAGCAVLTTGQLGILDIFTDGTNGFLIEAGAPETIARALQSALADRKRLGEIALGNAAEADTKYRPHQFTGAVQNILEAVAEAPAGKGRSSPIEAG